MPYTTTRRRSSPLAARGRQGQRRTSGGSGSRRGPAKQYIDPARFIAPARQAEAVEYTPQHRFVDFAIEPLLQRNIASKGYEVPSPIQDQTIPQGLEGRDVIGIANTGTGKTAAFALPILNRLLSEPFARALIIAPTRELAQQIEAECRSMARGSGLYGALLIGGSSMNIQLSQLSRTPSIVIGTPGRIKDHIQQGTLDLSSFTMLTLDEVDRMLDMGFIADIRFILGHVAEQRQSFFFSATIDPTIEQLMRSFLHDPVMVSVKTALTSENVEQDVVRYGSPHEKIERLHDILSKEEVAKALVFAETKRGAERLSHELVSRGFKSNAIHGGKTQGQRTRALKEFKENQINVLVATDVAARGIDIADITHVINYSTPQTYDDYVHRIGRAGRAGRTGTALTFIER